MIVLLIIRGNPDSHLYFLGFLLLRFIVLNKKLKKIIQTTNEHSEQQAQFIQNISVQMGGP